MSEQPVTANGLPKWDLADRMRKSLRHADMSVNEMANYLDVDRATVSTWINGRINPSVQTMRLWSLRTGVPYTWFCHGSLEPCDIAPVAEGERRSNKMHSQTASSVA